MSKQIKFLMSLLAFHLLFINSELLIKLTVHRFQLEGNIIFYIAVPLVIFASSYSFATVIIINKLKELYILAIAAGIDAIGTFINYVIDSTTVPFTVLTGLYFSIYTFYIIFISALIITRQSVVNNEKNESKKEIKPLTINEYYEKEIRLQNAINRTTKDFLKKERLKEELNQLRNNKPILTTNNKPAT